MDTNKALESIANELVSKMEELEARGKTHDEINSQMKKDFLTTCDHAFIEKLLGIMLDPKAGIAFVLSTQKVLGVWNSFAQENNFDLIHIRDTDLVNEILVATLEETFGGDIDVLIPKWQEQLGK